MHSQIACGYYLAEVSIVLKCIGTSDSSYILLCCYVFTGQAANINNTFIFDCNDLQSMSVKGNIYITVNLSVLR